jgi:hypothetical protein
MTDAPMPPNDTALVGGGWVPKMARAYEHLNFLKEDIRAFLERKPYSSVVQEQSWDDGEQRGIEWIFRAKIEEPPSDHWPIRIGEFLYNLRSGLDHFAYYLSSQNGTVPADERIEFPIFLKGKYYRRIDRRTGLPSEHSGLHKVRLMSVEAKTAIEKLQPYNGGHADDPLWLLESLRNFDAHKDIHVVGATINEPTLNISINQRGIRLAPAWDIHTGPFEDGAVLARCRVALRQVDPWPEFDARLRAKNRPGVEVKFSQPFDVAFDPAGPGAGKPVIAVLNDAYLAVLALTFNISQGFY